jgi:hypothetical protein
VIRNGYNLRTVRLRTRGNTPWYEVVPHTFVRALSRASAENRYLQDVWMADTKLGLDLFELYTRFGEFEVMRDDGSVDEDATYRVMREVKDLENRRAYREAHGFLDEQTHEAVKAAVLRVLDELEKLVDRETEDYTSRVEGRVLLAFLAEQRGKL